MNDLAMACRDYKNAPKMQKCSENTTSLELTMTISTLSAEQFSENFDI